MAVPKHKNPCPGGHEIYKFGRPFLGYHDYKLNLSDPCSVYASISKNPYPGVQDI